MAKSIDMERLAGHDCLSRNVWNINPKQEQEDYCRPSSPHDGTDMRDESPREDLSWAITPVTKVEYIRGFEAQNLQHEARPSPGHLSQNFLSHNNEIGHGDQVMGSSLKNDAVYSPAPLSARAPMQTSTPHFSSLQRPLGAPRGGPPVAAFTVQCSNCLKWRMIPTKEQYEAIRQCILQTPWVCENSQTWRPGASCEDPTDFSQDSGALWAIDRPNIPRPPPGWERKLVIRGEGSTKFSDIYYHSPCGKKLRSMVEVDRFLKEHPEYAETGVNLYQFSYSTPQPLKEGYVRRQKRDRELRNRCTATEFLLHQTIKKQLGDAGCQGKSMRGSVKRVCDNLLVRNGVPVLSPSLPGPILQTFSDRMAPCTNAQTPGSNLNMKTDHQIFVGNPSNWLSKAETTFKTELLSGAAACDNLSSDAQRGVDACSNGLRRKFCEEVQEIYGVNSNSSQHITYPFATHYDSHTGVPQFWKKKLRTVRVTPVIDLESE